MMVRDYQAVFISTNCRQVVWFKPENGIIEVKRQFYISTILCFLTTIGFTQSSITWQKLYWGASFVPGSCFSTNNSYFVASNTGLSNWILRVNFSGDTILSKSFNPGFTNSIASSNDGGCVFPIDGAYLNVIKLDTNGNITWHL